MAETCIFCGKRAGIGRREKAKWAVLYNVDHSIQEVWNSLHGLYCSLVRRDCCKKG